MPSSTNVYSRKIGGKTRYYIEGTGEQISQYRYRVLLAESRGKTRSEEVSQRARRRQSAQAAPEGTVARMTQRERQTYERVLGVIGDVRRGRMDLAHALRVHKTTRETVKKYAGEALGPKNAVLPTDTLRRPMRMIVDGRVKTVEVIGSQEASKLGHYWQSVAQYRATGDAAGLKHFSGQTIKTSQGEIPLEVDRLTLNELIAEDRIDFRSLYSFGESQ